VRGLLWVRHDVMMLQNADSIIWYLNILQQLHRKQLMSGMEVYLPYLLWTLAAVLVLLGLAGTILPMLPGAPLVFGGLLIAAWIGDFQRIGWPTLTILAILTVLAIVVDFVATLLGAKRAGASKLALLGAAIGSIVGLFFGLVAVFIFPFIGAVAGEYLARQKLDQASRVGLATWLGLLFGALAKLALALTMIGVFVVAYFM
jgi:uncharacterized protein